MKYIVGIVISILVGAIIWTAAIVVMRRARPEPSPATLPPIVCDCKFDITFPGADCTFINPWPDPEREGKP